MPARTSILWPLLATLVALAPFLGKAFHVDDTLFLLLARHLQAEPVDFYGFQVNWYGAAMAMSDVTKNPPLAGYASALVASVFGFDEVALHAAFLVPAAFAVAGTFRLAQGMTCRPLLAAVLALTSPVFWVSANTVMSDVLMLALFVWSVHLWREGLVTARPNLLLAAGVLAALAGLAKYFAVALVPLLLLDGLVRRRGRLPWQGVVGLAVPVAVFVGYELLTRAWYGRGLLSDAAGFSGAMRNVMGPSVQRRLVTGLWFAGGCCAFAACCAPLLVRGRAPAVLVLSMIVACAAGIGFLGRDGVCLGVDLRDLPLVPTAGVQLGAMLASGVTLAVVGLADLWRRRDADAVLLALWLGGTFVFAAFLNWTNNGRSNLPLAPAAAILVARALDRSGPRLVPLALAAACAVALGAVVAMADAVWANAVRDSARTALARHGGHGTLWFQGSWGFHWYMEQGGARRIDRYRDRIARGERIVVPVGNTDLHLLPWDKVGGGPEPAFDEWRDARPTFARTMVHGDGFYSGRLPFVLGRHAVERYLVYEAREEFVCEPAGR
ncbi:MAG: glycosyltransferase family 39 protein [Planctomycetes bacterium]|nr:glycosyltransferase family 39 protein [Planctomycetota bacterium]